MVTVGSCGSARHSLQCHVRDLGVGSFIDWSVDDAEVGIFGETGGMVAVSCELDTLPRPTEASMNLSFSGEIL